MGWTSPIPYDVLERLKRQQSIPAELPDQEFPVPERDPATVQRMTAPAAPSVRPEAEPTVERMPTVIQPAMPERNVAASDVVARMNPSTVTPEAPVAPELERMPAGPDFVGDQKRAGLNDPDPYQRRGAMINQGITTADEDELINRRIDLPTKPSPNVIDRGGFKGTLKSILRGAIQGLAIGGQRGGGQGIGGAIAGAIQGGVSPQSVENTYNETFRMPKYERDKAQAEADITNKEQMIERIGKRTGIDPATGQTTPDMELHRLDRTIKEEGVKGAAEARLSSETDRKMKTAQQAKGEHDLRHPGEQYGPEVTTAMPWLKGQKAPAKAKKPDVSEYSQTHIGTDGYLWGLRKDNGRMEHVLDGDDQPFKPDRPDRNDMTPAAKAADDRAQYAEANRLNSEVMKAESALAKANRRSSQMQSAIKGANAKGEVHFEGKVYSVEDAQRELVGLNDDEETARQEREGAYGAASAHPRIQIDPQPGPGGKRNVRILPAPAAPARQSSQAGQGGQNVPRVYKSSALPQIAQQLFAAGKIDSADAQKARAYIEANGGTVSDKH